MKKQNFIFIILFVCLLFSHINGFTQYTVSVTANPGSICSGSTSQLSASPIGGNAPYTYSWASSPTGFSSTIANPTVAPTTSTSYSSNIIYTVTVTDATSSTVSNMVSVYANPTPSVTVGTSASKVCTGGTIDLSANSPDPIYTYLWASNPSGFSSSMQNPTGITVTTTTTYMVTVTNNYMCTASNKIVILADSLNPVTISSNPPVVCSGTTAQLNVSTSGGILPFTYSWASYPTGFSSTLANPTISPTISSTYSVTISDSLGCWATKNIVVTLYPKPTGTVTGTTPICRGTSTSLSVNPTGGTAPYTYSWASSPTGFSATIKNPTASPTNTTTYTVTFTDNKGCSNTGQKTIAINASPSVSASGSPTSFCLGGSTTLSATPSGGTTPYTYTWSNSLGTTQTVNASPTTNTTYTITVTDNKGCSASNTVLITVYALPSVTAGGGTICSGSSTSITAGGASTYSWSSGLGMGTPKSVSPTLNTTYTVTGTDANSCTNTATAIVTVNTLPTATASATPASICIGSSSQLSSTGGGTYSWSSGCSTSQTCNVSPASNTTYTVTVTLSGCTATATTAVMVNAKPTVTAGGATICDGSSASITAGGASTYSWSSGLGMGTPKSVSPTMNTTYTVTGTDANSCTNTATAIVTVNALPIATASATPSSICIGSSTQLSSSGGGTYSWSSGCSTSQTCNVSPASNTTYTVTVTLSGCTATATTAVMVNAKPTVTAGGATICNGSSASITAGGASTYSWSSGLGTGTPKSVSPTLNTTYTVTGTNVNSCTNTANAVVVVNALPNVTFNGSYFICFGGSTNLNASGANTYSWSNGLGTGTPKSVSPTSNTTYTVTGTDANGCTNTASNFVTVNPEIIVNIQPSASVICKGNSFTLSANASGGSTPYIYAWSDGVTLSKIFNPITPITSSATYTVTVSDNYYCYKTDSIVITVNDLPTVISNGRTICVGLSITITASGANTYSWNSGDGTTGSGTLNHIYVTAGTFMYSVTGTDANNCSNTASALVNVNSLPSVTTSNDAQICIGANITLTASGGMNYSWNNGEASNNVVITPDSTSTYTVTVTDVNNCSNSKNIQITVLNQQAGFSFTLDKTTKTILASDTSKDAISLYYWNLSDGFNSNSNSIDHKFSKSGNYQVCMNVKFTQGGCLASVCNDIVFDSTICKAGFTWTLDNINRNVSFALNTQGNFTNYFWELGDGNYSIISNPVNSYAKDGYYKVALHAVDTVSGCIDEISNIITIQKITTYFIRDCKADYIYTANLTNNEVWFSNNSIGNDIQKFIWDFGDGTIDSTSGGVVTHTFSKNGIYSVCLNIVGNYNKSFICKEIKLNPDANTCVANFSYAIDTLNNKVYFSDKSLGNPTEWNWDFGDGGSSNVQNPTYLYKTTGIYQVHLNIKNSNTFCNENVNKIINVNFKKIRIKGTFGFIFNNNYFAKGVFPVDFKGATYGDPNEVSWDFGDSTSNSTTLDPTHNYTAPGEYKVCMTVTNSKDSISDEYCDTVTVAVLGIKTIHTNDVSLNVYPNPFNNISHINYQLPVKSSVQIKVYDMIGNLISTIINEEKISGTYTYEWNTDKLSVGIYYLNFITRDKTIIKKIVKMK